MSGIIKFDSTLPAADTPIRSAPLRSNMNALNDRTNQLTPSPTAPISKKILIGPADKVYFNDNFYAPYNGGELDLGSSDGVDAFTGYKEVIVYYVKSINNDGTIAFVEGTAQPTPTRDTSKLINETHLNTLKDSILICSILVSSSGGAGKGQINSISAGDIIDLRPFLQKGGYNSAFKEHASAATLELAHPSAKITNSILALKQTNTTETTTNNANITVTNISQIASGDVLQISKDVIPTSSSWVTAKVTSVSGNTINLDRSLSIPSGAPVLRMDIGQPQNLPSSSITTPSTIAIDIIDELSRRASVTLTTAGNISTVGSISGTSIAATAGNISITSGAFSANGTTLTDSGGKILSAALNTVAIAQGGTGLTTSPTNGQLLIGNGSGYTLATLSGTNITVTSGAGSIAIALPQSVATSASPTFAGLTISNPGTLTISSLSTGILHSNASGILSSSTIIDSDISTSAAIARSKVASIAGSANYVVINDATGALSSEAQLSISRGGTGASTKNTAFNALSPMTTLGDIIYGNTSGSGDRLAGNTSTTKQFLSSAGTGSSANTPQWSSLATTDITTGTLAIARGGTGLSTTPTNGQLLIGNGSGFTLASLTAGNGIGITSGSGTITVATTLSSTSAALATGATSITVSNALTYLTYAAGFPATTISTITVTTPFDGQLIYVNIANSSSNLISLSATGNIDLSSTTAQVGAGLTNIFTFVYRSSTSKWILLSKLV